MLHIRTGGISLKDLIAKSVQRVAWRESVVYRYAGILPEEPDLPRNLQWDQATQELIDAVMADAGSRRDALKRLLAQGSHGIIIHNGRHWAAHGFFSPPGVRLPKHMPNNLVREPWWLFYMHTHPDWRRRGLQKACVRLKIRYIFDLGGNPNKIMVDTGLDNVPARKGFLRTGFEPAGVIRTLELRVPKLGTRLLYINWNPGESHKEI